jgi:hypothetical protein
VVTARLHTEGTGTTGARAVRPTDPNPGSAAHECPLCRQSFASEDMNCHDNCFLGRRCGVLCCPHCGYEFVDTRGVERRFSRLGGFLRRIRGRG